MSLPLEFHPSVRRETAAAHDWYEQLRPGLGTEFLDEVQHVLGEIVGNPARDGYAYDTVREGLLNRFPYAVYYCELSDRIRILAVYHTARDPSGWQVRT